LRARHGQVKRMLAAVGNRCERLHRVAIGGILLGELHVGEWRHLTPEEVETLLQKNYE
jgi:16S rRNA pseudouridine516 synthase